MTGDARARVVARVASLNDRAAAGDPEAFYAQQLLLHRIYGLVTSIPRRAPAEGSIVLHEMTRQLETATIGAQDQQIDPDLLDEAPADGKAYVAWLKGLARRHPAFKHPYYVDFIHHHAQPEDLRTYVIQESAVDAGCDDLLAMVQVGTDGPEKMEIAANFWDEMGNGDPAGVHTHLFDQIFGVFDIDDADLGSGLTGHALLPGNLAASCPGTDATTRRRWASSG